MAQTAARAASQATGVGALLESEGREGVLEMLLAGLLGGVAELLQPQRDFWLGLAATIDELELTDQALVHGLPAAVLLLCATPGPEDLRAEGVSFEGALGTDGREVAHLFASGLLGERALPLEVDVETREDASTVRLRGGGWLLCGLSEGDLEVDGEPLDLGDHDRLAPDLDVRVWPEPTGDVAADSVTPEAVEVVLTLELDHEVLLPIVAAAHLTVWLADEPVEVTLEGNAAVAELRTRLAVLAGEVPSPAVEATPLDTPTLAEAEVEAEAEIEVVGDGVGEGEVEVEDEAGADGAVRPAP
jgi:hypothetical protein